MALRLFQSIRPLRHPIPGPCFAFALLLGILLLGAGAGREGPPPPLELNHRLWLAGQEVGGRTQTQGWEGQIQWVEQREWTRLERLGSVLDTEVRQTTRRAPDGSLTFAWSLRISAQPMEGEASWNPAVPRQLELRLKGTSPRRVELPAGCVLWPLELERLSREAALRRQPLKVRSFSLPLQQPTELDLQPRENAPLPGFPDCVRFSGRSLEGAMAAEVEAWISPKDGEVKEQGNLGGLPVLVQRRELPSPRAETGSGAGFFERTLAPLPPDPFGLWRPEAVLTWEGPGLQKLPEDAQQQALGPGRLRLRRAETPTAEEAAQGPSKGKPSAEEAPYLAATPLVPFEEPVFEGLLNRLRAPKGASRWELTRRVVRFVFEWIEQKDYSVGFAPAQEVARTPRGDCTEHGVLAVALLRRLGVPSRGALGWVALQDTFGLHFWVEVRLGERWIPVDPTFDEAPASTLHLRMGDTNLSDLGSVGWDTLAVQVAGGRWKPEGNWGQVHLQGEVARGEGGALKVKGGSWTLEAGRLILHRGGPHPLRACPRPAPALLKGARLHLDPVSGNRGWCLPASRTLFLRLGEDRWIQLDQVREGDAASLVEAFSWIP